MKPIDLGHEGILACYVAEYLLKRGYEVAFVGHGPSMEPRIPDKTKCHIRPTVIGEPIREGQVVFIAAHEGGITHFALHKVIRKSGSRYLIGWNDERFLDGWFRRKDIAGIYVGAIK